MKDESPPAGEKVCHVEWQVHDAVLGRDVYLAFHLVLLYKTRIFCQNRTGEVKCVLVDFKGFANRKITRFQGFRESKNHTFSMNLQSLIMEAA